MNTKRVSAVIIVASLTALVVWWRWPAAAAPNTIPLVHVQPLSAPEAAEDPPVMPLPPEPVVPHHAQVEATEALPPAPPPAFDPQADLSTAIPDIIRLLQSGDLATAVVNYSLPQSGISDEAIANLQAYMQTPQFKQIMQEVLAEMQFIQNSPPVISDNGNRATYALPAGSPKSELVFIKVNGRWYRY